MKKPKTQTSKRPAVRVQRLVSPFVEWGDRYFGLSVQDGRVTADPSEDKDWTEYHLEYRGGIWELEVCPTENTGWTVWRGKIPTREIFVTLMQNIEEAPPIDWANSDSASLDITPIWGDMRRMARFTEVPGCHFLIICSLAGIATGKPFPRILRILRVSVTGGITTP